jgi:hypothetical protein
MGLDKSARDLARLSRPALLEVLRPLLYRQTTRLRWRFWRVIGTLELERRN